MRIEPSIEVVETNHEADRHESVVHVVNESAAEFLVAQRPADRVNHTAAGLLLFGNVPDFLDADGVHLRVAVAIESELLHELLRERSPRAFGQDRYFRANI